MAVDVHGKSATGFLYSLLCVHPFFPIFSVIKIYCFILVSILNFNYIITARKRSLRQGNILTGVCLSTGRLPGPGGCLVLGVAGLGGACSRGGTCSRGVPAPEECLHPGGGGAWSQGGAWSGRLFLQAVRILLECILVNVLILHFRTFN